MFAALLLVAAITLGAAWITVLARQPQELVESPGASRAHVVLTHWLDEGYFHYVGMINRDPKKMSLYRSTTGAYMVSSFIVEKIHVTMFGRYSYRLLALHNEVVTMILCALAGLLSYRLARRFGLEPILALAAGASVVIVLFTFPESLQLYWEMTAQSYALLFALVFLILEERGLDHSRRTRGLLIAQAVAVFLMTAMEMIFGLCFAASLVAAIVLLRRGESFRRFLLVAVLPCLAGLAVYLVQVKIATARFPDAPTTGSNILFRTGLDGDASVYGDHLDIALNRTIPRGNWAANRQYLFRWPTVFFLGVASIFAVLIAFVRGRAPRFALEALATLTGAWVLYAAVFSQSVKVHPWLFDLLLFAPLAIALFAVAPSLLESVTGRTGAIVLVFVFSAFWYSLFQMRLYSLRYPTLPPPAASAAPR
ncbi:MAG: hypothetical protein M3P06_14300 [Acidobacteriota bacterium]|nr:hypothetical protein [Acidobacteriota bacterium]